MRYIGHLEGTFMSAVACPWNPSLYATGVINIIYRVLTLKFAWNRPSHVSLFHFNDTLIAAIQIQPCTTMTTEDLCGLAWVKYQKNKKSTAGKYYCWFAPVLNILNP